MIRTMHARAAALFLALAWVGVGCTGTSERAAAARTENLAAARSLVVESPVTVLAGGEVVAQAETVEEALRSLAEAGAGAEHRLWVLAERPGGRLLPLVFLPAGGWVAGEELLRELGVRRVERTGRPTLLRHGTKSLELPVDSPHLELELRALGDGEAGRVDARRMEVRRITVPLLRDFPAALLLPPDALGELDGDLTEVAGTDEVQVALGRPFRARRALIRVRIPALDVDGVVLAVSETALRR